MTPLRKRAEAAARLCADKICWEDGVTLPKTAERWIADAIEAEARAFAERALRSIYEVDDNDQWSSDGERARGSFRVKAEFCGRPHTESRRYRAEFDEMVTQILSAAEKVSR